MYNHFTLHYDARLQSSEKGVVRSAIERANLRVKSRSYTCIMQYEKINCNCLEFVSRPIGLVLKNYSLQ